MRGSKRINILINTSAIILLCLLGIFSFQFPNSRIPWLFITIIFVLIVLNAASLFLQSKNDAKITGMHVKPNNISDENNDSFKMFMDRLPGLVYIKDSELKAIFVNKGFRTYLNMEPELMLNKTSLELFPPEFAAQIEADDIRALASGSPSIIEEEFAGKHWLTNKFVIHSTNGNTMLGGITLDITEKKKAEETARKLSHAVEQSPLSIVITDRKGNIEYVNPKFSELTGYSFDEVKGRNSNILKSNLHPKEVYKNLWDTIGSGKIWNGEFLNIKKNGDEYWESAAISPIFNDKGEITHFMALKENITDKKRTEQSLQRQNTLLRIVIDNVPDLIYSKDLKARKTLANKADLKLMKLGSEAEALGKDDFAFFPPEQAKEYVEEDLKIIETGKPSLDTEGWHTDIHGNKHWFITSKYPLHDEKGNVTGLVGIGRDITERKLKETQLEKHLQVQSNLVELLSNDSKDIQQFLNTVLVAAIKITDSKIGYIYHYDENKKEFILNSWSKEVMKECSIMNPQTVYQLEKTGIWGEAVRQRKEIIVNEYSEANELKKGYPLGHVELKRFATIPVFKGSQIVAVVGVGNKDLEYDESDINNLKQLMGAIWEKVDKIKAEIALTESEANLQELNATKDKFFSIIAHDLKSPFNTLLNLSNMLLSEYKDLSEEDRLSFIHSIDTISSSTYNLLENLLEWSRMQIGKMNFNPEKSNVLVLLYPTIKLFIQTAKNKNIDFKYDIDKTIEIVVDRYMFDTIVRNLISNAIKFTKPGGNISLVVKNDNENLTVSVADSGVGISSENIDGIFKIGNNVSTRGTDNEQGTGLGLLLCKEMVEKHDGKIWVESEVGKGTTFTFELPAA